MEDIVYTVYCVFNGRQVSDIAYKEFDFIADLGHFRLKLMAHIVLLFSSLEKCGFRRCRSAKSVEHRIAE